MTKKLFNCRIGERKEDKKVGNLMSSNNEHGYRVIVTVGNKNYNSVIALCFEYPTKKSNAKFYDFIC